MTASSSVASLRDEKYKRMISAEMPHPVALPKHIFLPEDSQSLEFRVLVLVPDTTVGTIFTFTAPPDATTMFTSYNIVASPASNLTGSFFTPFVNKIRVLPYHGNPDNKFRMDVSSTAGDFSDTPTKCVLQLQPGDVLTWTFTNNSGDDVNAAVVMSGYIDTSTTRKMGRFGG